MKRCDIHLPVPPPWVNAGYERLQREKEMDRRIARAYAEDYGNPVRVADIVKAIAAAVGMWAALVLVIVIGG